MRKFSFIVLLQLLVLSLSGCATGGSSDGSSDGLSQLAKSDIDQVTEVHQRAVMHDLKLLMLKLYKRNPRQRYDRNQRTIAESVKLTFSRPLNYHYPQWQGKVSKPSDIIRLAFDESYHGDRVLAFVVGLRLMLMASYDNHSEFFYLTSIDQQKLYNSARNIEIAAWLLAEKRDQHGHLFLLSDSMQGKTHNLSFQRLIGEMIATQDNLAVVISEKSGRILKTFVVQAATMAFLPI